MTGQSATMVHPECWQKAEAAITAPFAGRRPRYPLMPVGSRRVMEQPANSGQHDVSNNSFESYNSYHSYNSYNSYNTATLAPFDRYRTACQ